MKQMLARLRGHKPQFRILFDEDNLPKMDFFKFPEVGDGVEYAPFKVDLEKNEWFYVELNLEQIQLWLEPYTESNKADTPKAEQPEYGTIDAIFLSTGRRIIFSRITNSMRVDENGQNLIKFNEENVELVQPSFAINMSGDVDAYYDGTKRLYFQNLQRIRPLFKGIEMFYQDASREDKEAFLDNDFFAVEEINPDFIGVRDALAIVSIMENQDVDINDDETQQKIREYANKYPSCGARIDDEGRIMIKSKADLSATIKLLDQKFFTSEITGEWYEAKSTSKLKR